jgi:hypothetical protein
MSAVIVAVGLAALAASWPLYPTPRGTGSGPRFEAAQTNPAAATASPGGPTDGSLSARASTSATQLKRPSDRAAVRETSATLSEQADIAGSAPIPPSLTPASIRPAALSLPALSPAPVSEPVQTPATPTATAIARATSGEIVVNVNKDAVIGVRLDQTVTTDTARVDDKVTARVSRDVVVDGRTAIPAGARLEGVVTLVERAGPSHARDKLGIRFNTLVLSGNHRVSIQTDTIFRDSERGEPLAAQGASAALGARVSGGRPSPLPNMTGRTPARLIGAGTADARIPGGSPLTVKLTAPLSIVLGSDLAST